MANAQPKPEATGVILTPNDVDRLLKDDSPDSRIGVLEKVSTHYNGDNFADREREIAEQIFRLLMKDAALRVRETLADRMKENPEVPRDIVLHMANDVEQVSLPVLKASQVLSDADLVNIIEASNDINKLMAISQREAVSSRVSDALVDTSYPQVVSSLVGNEGAAISDRAFEKIVDDFRGEPAVINAMVDRKSLPVTLVERLMSHASTEVAAQLKEKYKLSDAQMNKDSGDAHEDLMLKLLAHDISEHEVIAVAAQMDQEGRLTPSIVLTALCRGQLLFFTVAMARFAGISVENAKRLLSDKGPHGFQGLYSKSNLPESMATAVRLILNKVIELQDDEAIPGSLMYANRLVAGILAVAGDQNIEYLPYFIAIIRQNVHRH